MPNSPIVESKEGRIWLWFYAYLTCYRYRNSLNPLSIPEDYPSLTSSAIQEKAKASLVTAGVFFGFSVAVLTGVLGTGALKDSWTTAAKSLSVRSFAFHAFTSFLLPYLAIWFDRFISSTPSDRGHPSRRWRQWMYRISFTFAFCFFIVYPLFCPRKSQAQTSTAPLSGLALTLTSAVVLLFSLELYDTCIGWKHADDREYLFHLANLASHSYVVGLFAALVGVSELFFLLDPWIGRVVTLTTLMACFGLSQIERGLYGLQPRPK